MARKLILVAIYFLIPWAACFYEQPATPIIPKGYRIDLQLVPEEGYFRGNVKIDIVSRGTEPVTEIEIDASSSFTIENDGIKLIRLANSDFSDEESDEDTPISVSGIERKEKTIIIRCSQKLQRDATYQLDIIYQDKLGTDSSLPFYMSNYTDKFTSESKWFVVLNSRPGQAHLVFPCFDQPYLKSWFELTVTHRHNMTALSNMPILEQTNVSKEKSQLTDKFMRTPVMTVSSLGLFISQFTKPDVKYLDAGKLDMGIKYGVWARPDFVATLSKAMLVLPSVLVSLEIYLSRPYPLPHINFVALPGYTEDRPKNSWGLQWFKESDLMNGNSYWLTHRLAKAAAMQWVGHLATPVNDSYVTSGLANFLATNVAQQLEPTVYHWNLGVFHTLVLELGKPRNYGLDSEQKRSLTESRVYLLIQMLEQVFGETTFKQSIQNFLAKKEFKAYADDDLWQVITEQAWVDNKLASNISLSDVIPCWLSQRIPLVTVNMNRETKTTTFTQEKFVDSLESTWSKVVKKDGVDKKEGWWLPLVISEGGKEPRTIGWIPPEQSTLPYTVNNLSTAPFIVANPGSTGPYLVNYDNVTWKNLAVAMKNLPVTYRAQLIHDSLTLALSGHLNTVTALEITASLKTEQAPEVWKTFYPLAERLRNRFQGTSASHNLDAYLKGLLIPVLDALGEEDKSSWKTELRVRTRHLLCQTGFSPCIENARTLYAVWQNATHPDDGMPIATSHLCPVMTWGNYDEWNFAFERLTQFPANRSKAERTFLMKTVAGCPHDPKKYETLLNMTFLKRSLQTFSDEDRFIILSAIAGESVGYTTLFNFLKFNWSELKRKVQGNLWDYFVQTAIGNFRTEEGLKEVTELLNERRSELATALKTAEDSVGRVRARVKWTKEATPAVEAWLNKTMEASWTPQRFKFQDIVVVSQS